jgi:hypothetical protein
MKWKQRHEDAPHCFQNLGGGGGAPSFPFPVARLLMAKKDKRQKHTGRFAAMPHHIARSHAWRHVSANARCAWLELALRFNGQNNGEISLSCREVADDLGISKNTASKAFDRLVVVGLIRMTADSSFSLKSKKARRWRLTHLADDRTGQASSGEWHKWRPPEVS